MPRQIHNHHNAIPVLTGVLVLAMSLLNLAPEANATVVMDKGTISSAVKAHVEDRLGGLFKTDKLKGAMITVTIPNVPGGLVQFDTTDDANDIEMDLESSFGQIYSDRGVVRVKMTAPSGEHRELGVPVHLIVKKQVWVVKNNVNANSPIVKSDLQLEVREVSQQFSHVVGTELDLSAYTARVNLRPGDLLDDRKLKIPPDVRMNDEIRIVMTNNKGMVITVFGTAMAEGRKGDMIRVKQVLYNNTRPRYYNAQIIDKNRVLVTM